MVKNTTKTYNNRIPDGREKSEYLNYPEVHVAYSIYTEIKAVKNFMFTPQINDEITGSALEEVNGTAYSADEIGIAEYILVTFAENLVKGNGLKNTYDKCVSSNVSLSVSVPMFNTVTHEIKFTAPLQLNYPRAKGIYFPWEKVFHWFRSLFTKKARFNIQKIENSTSEDTNEDGSDQ